jgi:signal transduction histidine kinase
MTLALAESDRRYDSDDLAHAVDLASRCAMAMENAELFQQAKEAVGLRDEFLSIASHELRTPLSTLQLLLQSVERVVTRLDSRELVAQIKRILRQLDRLTELVSKLLDVTRIGAGQLALDFEEFDAVPVVQEIVERFAEPARAAGSRLQLRLPELLICRADRLRLDQILTNLLSNAIKFGAGKPIDILLQGSPSHLELTVRDQGIGIPAEHLARIFDRFERAVSSRHYGGLGLGLYITRRIVEAHRGTVQVESSPGSGAAFTVTLPRDGAAAEGSAGDA